MEPWSSSDVPNWRAGLSALLADGEMWLMERVFAYAKAQGYTAYTATMVEAWRVSIAGLTDAIVSALTVYDGAPHEYPLILQPQDDPIAAFAVLEAKRHRGRGVTLAMFWGLLKYYRRTYLDLLSQRLAPGEGLVAASDFIAECFERMEFVFVLRWTELEGQEAVDELGRENRRLANEKSKYLSVFESVPHALFLLDAEGRVENCNAGALRMLGHGGAAGALYYAGTVAGGEAVAAVLGQPLARLLPWLERPLADVDAARDGRIALETRTDVGGQTYYYSAAVERMRDISGKYCGKVVLCRDVTERRLTEMALAASEERYRTVLEIMHQGLVIFSPEGRIDFANDTLGELLGLPLRDVLGRFGTEFIRSSDRAHFVESLAGRRKGLADPYEMTLCRADGRQVCVMSSPSPIIGQDGDYQGSLEVFTDVTRLHRLEAQLVTAKRLEAIGHLAGGVAHEINTPLQYVSGNLDFVLANLPRVLELLDKCNDALRLDEGGGELERARREIEAFRREHDLETVLAELTPALEESRVGTERVAGFVRTIKRFARAEGTGRQAIDVNEAILATVEIAKSVEEIPVCMETHLAEDLPPLSCVPGDFNQLLLCLLLNAFQATRQGGGAGECVRIESRLEGRAVAVSVSDSGPGIPPEIRDRILSPFPIPRGDGEEAGQDLSIALSVVEKHKGAIRYVTEPGRGTTFHVTFPLE